jgi:hypothetical protein
MQKYFSRSIDNRPSLINTGLMANKNNNNNQWFERAVGHLENIQGIKEGLITDFWREMTAGEAIEIEERNVVFCLAQIG